tara:strand:- start:1090 stop:1593 length:504 start_codon:yes stop_codon:yes gene_type:complete
LNSNAYLGLGGNLGDPIMTFQAALSLIARFASVVSVSRLFHSAPFGYTKQAPFVNAAAHLTTDLTPLELLDHLQYVEGALGKEVVRENGPRIIDLDLLLFDDLVLESDRLTLPHPAILQRDFVLLPLEEIAPGLSNRAWGSQTLKSAIGRLPKRFVEKEPVEWNYRI